MKLKNVFLAVVGFGVIMILSWCASQSGKTQGQNNAKLAEPTPGMSAPAGWSLKHAIYAVNTAVEGADTTVLDLIVFDKQTKEIRFNQAKTNITNLDEVAANLPNTVPVGTFEEKPMKCERNMELESSFYTAFDCR